MSDIFDIKSEEELKRHESNWYKSKLTNRKKNVIIQKFTNDNIIVSKEMFLVNIKKLSGFEGSYYFNGKDPLVNTALQMIKNDNMDIKDTFLYNYYENFQPKTYGEVYYLNKNNKLHELESTNFFLPWFHKNPTNTFRAGIFGPKDFTSVKHRIIRIKNLINNIKEYGYIPSDNDIIEGYILLKDNDFRFIITAGHHRVAVLTALYMNNNVEYENIEVKYDIKRINVKIVDENNVCSWPGVESNYLSQYDALEMFNQFFK